MPADFLTRNMFFHQAQDDTPSQGLSGQGFTGNPQQLMQMMQSPQMQQQLQNFGINFDPSMMQQSPFIGNQFMQQHPRLGGMFTGAMANLAAMPEAPMVSGFGSGLSRMAQGAAGGPEMLRQYQLRQLMAPFQAVGMQMPMMGEMRRQKLLDALLEDMRNRQGLSEESETHKWDIAQRKQQLEQQKQEFERGQATPYGIMTPMTGQQFQSPEGMPSELGGQMTGPQLPQGSQMLPGGHWAFTPYQTGMIAGQAQAKETPATTDLKKAQATRQRAEAGAATEKGKLAGARAGSISGKDVAKLDQWQQDRLNKIEQASNQQIVNIQASKLDDEAKKNLIERVKQNAETQKANVTSGYGTGMKHLRQQTRDIPENSGQAGPTQIGPTQAPTSGLHRDEAGNLWDYTDPNKPKYAGKWTPNAPTGQR